MVLLLTEGTDPRANRDPVYDFIMRDIVIAHRVYPGMFRIKRNGSITKIKGLGKP